MGSRFNKDTADAQLVREFVENSNSDAFAEIYERYVDATYRFIFMRVGRKEWAEEIVSDTFYTLLRILPNFRQESQLKTFIIGVAINKVRQFWQSKEKEGLSLREEIVVLDEPEDANNYVENAENQELVLKIMKLLETPYKEVLEKRFIEGRSIKETAEALKLSEANVRVIQHRALKKAAVAANNLKTVNKSGS